MTNYEMELAIIKYSPKRAKELAEDIQDILSKALAEIDRVTVNTYKLAKAESEDENE